MARFDLTDFEWGLIQPLLPNKPRGVARVDDRRVLNGIFWVLRTGSPWRDLPERYGPPTTVYNRFNRWTKAGVWVRVFEALAEKSPDSLLHAASGKKGGADHAIGRSRGGLSTKINVMVGARGLPVALCLTPGQASDKAAVAELVERHPRSGTSSPTAATTPASTASATSSSGSSTSSSTSGRSRPATRRAHATISRRF